MTNNELNLYIKHYIEKDKTGRAIMLSGAWGTGKSYYIKNDLIPFLMKTENGEHSCIVVSLYGLKNLTEISKAIYLEARFKNIKKKADSEAGCATILVAKTLLKGVTSFFGVDLNADENSLKDLYKSIDLSGKLIILEDVERSNIGIFEILGYVNSLVEQDNVKVMLVTNEDEILKYDYVEKTEKEITQSDVVVGHKQNGNALVKYYTKETIRYLETKEKSIGDTIRFEGNSESAIREVIKSFDNMRLQQYATDQIAADIATLMFISNSSNLRSVIFACQKTVDIYEHIENSTYSDDFLRTIFYGIVAFSLRIHAGADNKWVGKEQYSEDLGIPSYPLFRFCYDYIMTQHMDLALVSDTAEAFEKMRLYDANKTSRDPDLLTLTQFAVHTESDVITAIRSITHRLGNIEDISFYDYGRIASALVTVKHELGVEIDETKRLLIDNLKGRGNDISGNDLFLHTISTSSTEEQQEFSQLREEMIKALDAKGEKIPGFKYLPEQAFLLYDYATKRIGEIYNAHGFAQYLDISRLAEMFFKSTPEQMHKIRCAFLSLYRSMNIKDFLSNDLAAIVELKSALELGQTGASIDKVQQMQCRWFVDQLEDIKNRLT